MPSPRLPQKGEESGPGPRLPQKSEQPKPSLRLLQPGEQPSPPPLAAFLANPQGSSVLLTPEDEAEALAPHLAGLTLIALDFPAFNDGRPYSNASILRRKYAYQGDLRAQGDIRIDQLEQMVRCGFTSFELAAGQDAALAQTRLAGFPHSYQPTADRPPLFRHR